MGGDLEGAGCEFAGAGEVDGAEIFGGFRHVGDGDWSLEFFDMRV